MECWVKIPNTSSLQLYFSLEKDSSILLALFRIGGGIQFVHLYGLNFFGVGYGWVDSFTRDELAVLGHDFETVVAEKVIDQCLLRVRMMAKSGEVRRRNR